MIMGVIASVFLSGLSVRGVAASGSGAKPKMRVRPGDPGWPSASDWEMLDKKVGGRLTKPQSPFLTCGAAADSTRCAEALKQLKNPFYLGDQVALTQTSGWAEAWTSQPSAYAVEAHNTADVVAAVKFAREHNLRFVVKGGGHSYQGTSCAPDSLLVWTRRMNDVTLHDAFVAHGCDGKHAPQPAVTLGAGAMWIDAYDAVTTRGGRYVQGGGCTTVGVAGLVQGGGFGSFSKNYGTAAAGLLEAEIVTADGTVRIANACTHPDLFWSIKGGGGSTFGVITRLTLRTRELPEYFGAVFGAVKASSDIAYRALIGKAISLYKSALFNPHWGEQMTFRTDNTLRISMVFHGLTQEQAQATWAPFIDWVRTNNEYSVESELKVISLSARHFWDAEFLKKNASGFIVADDRPGAPNHHMLWAGDQGQVGWYIRGYKSAWLPAALLDVDRQSSLVDAVFASTRQWEMAFHFNKGLAGAPPEEIEAARNTSTNPRVLDAFALAIMGAGGPPTFVGLPDPKPDAVMAQEAAARIGKAMNELLIIAPAAGSYVSESDYFERDWQTSFWGKNYPELIRIKMKYDPEGLFFVHHGVGSEAWNADGFNQLSG
jgi:FAD/FMN-containing dehydrogenase